MYATMIWERIIGILTTCGLEGLISFGYVIWWSLQKNVWMCGAHDSSLALIVHKTHWTWTTIECTQIWGSRNLQEAWSTVASISLWNIWKFRCLKWYSGETHTIVDAITTIWTIYWYPRVHNSKTCREIQSLKSWHELNLSHSRKPHHWWTSCYDVKNGTSKAS